LLSQPLSDTTMHAASVVRVPKRLVRRRARILFFID
jgi:hypothetical protein